VPLCVAIEGQAVDTGLYHLLISYEQPIPYFDPVSLMDKTSTENLHMGKYCTDYRITNGNLPYSNLRTNKNDPPDFIAVHSGEEVRIDCAQFTIEKHRTAQALFNSIRKTALSEPREKFDHLSGSLVLMWFRDGDSLGLPPRASDDQQVKQIIEALARYTVDHSGLILPGGSLPPLMPSLNEQTLPGGCTFYSTPITPEVMSSRFFMMIGFELGLVYGTSHTSTSAWEEIGRLVTNHDQAVIDDLIITAGAPGRDGIGFVSEYALARFMLRRPQMIAPPSHLRRVMIHLWQTGEIVQLFPELKSMTQIHVR
jgi:hypothetical protein